MSRILCMLSCVAVVSCAVLFEVNKVAAQTQPKPPLSCTITNLGAGTTVNVTAGVVGSSFPDSVACPSPNTLGVTECLRWRYTFTSPAGTNLSSAFLTLSSDVDVVAVSSATAASCDQGPNPDSACPTGSGITVSTPGSPPNDSPIGQGVFDVAVVKDASASPPNVETATIFTKQSIGIGTTTAAVKLGTKTGSCAIAGPDNIVSLGTGKIAITTTVVDQAGQCQIVRTVDAAGCTLNIAPTDPANCTVTQEVITLANGETFSGGTCSTQITFGSTSKYCYVMSFGGMNCVCLNSAC